MPAGIQACSDMPQVYRLSNNPAYALVTKLAWIADFLIENDDNRVFLSRRVEFSEKLKKFPNG